MIKQNNNDNQLLSNVFDFLRFPLIVGVIFIHAHMDNFACSQNVDSGDLNYPFLFYINNLFSQVISRVAVPLFFFMSGYLFFYKVRTFEKSTYLSKLKNRFNTLLVPYILWNVIGVLVYLLLANFSFTSKFFSNSAQLEYSTEWMHNIFMGPNGPELLSPWAYQFWFIRDLIVCVIISPVIYFFIDKTSWWGITALCILWICNWNIPILSNYGFSTVAIFFFSAGAWFSVKSLNIIYYTEDLKIVLILYPIVVLLDLFTKNTVYNQYIHAIGILIGIVFVFVLSVIALKKNLIKPVPFLSSASFFIFAIHEPWVLTTVKKLLLSNDGGLSDIQLCLIYFLEVIITIILSLMIYFILKKLTPRLVSIITGKR